MNYWYVESVDSDNVDEKGGYSDKSVYTGVPVLF